MLRKLKGDSALLKMLEIENFEVKRLGSKILKINAIYNDIRLPIENNYGVITQD